MDILHPPRAGSGGSDNADSLVVRLVYLGRTLVLPGDLEPPGSQQFLAQQPQVNCNVLMAPHHGSIHSSPREILNSTRPDWVVISGAGDARACASALAEYAQLGASVFHTGAAGAIRIRVSREGITTRAWKAGAW
jgi:competence protein ComEC